MNFTISATSTVQDLVDFMEEALGIQNALDESPRFNLPVYLTLRVSMRESIFTERRLTDQASFYLLPVRPTEEPMSMIIA